VADGALDAPIDLSNFPLTINNCGIEITYAAPPQRAVSMNQSTTEIMLKLGLEKQMVGTGNLVDSVLPELEAAYHTVPILADGYPAQEVVFAAEPDFVYGAFRGAFADEAAGPRAELLKLGINSYVSPLFCEDRALAAKEATFDLLYGEIRDIGRIFGVDARAEALITEMQSGLDEVQRTIGEPSQRARVVWYDSNIEEPFVGACCGAPAMLMAAAGAENIFADTEGTWAVVNWESIVDRAPEVIVFVESDWSTVEAQIDYLLNEPAFASIPAVQNQRFVVVPFSATTLGVRNVAGVVELAKGLYPEKFE
jgi:iron complex transport system substrate-binding protein